MKKKIRVVIADDHDIYLEGLENRLNSSEDIVVLASAPNGEKLVELVNQYEPDVVITDIRMPVMDGMDAIREIKKINRQLPILVLTTFDNTSVVVDSVAAGATGYILKDASKEEVIDAVRKVYNHIPYYCSRINSNLSRMYNNKVNLNASSYDLFTPFERKIIHYICEEKTSEEISALLFLGKRSIENYRCKILAKMKVKTSVGLVNYAHKNALYPLPEAILLDR